MWRSVIYTLLVILVATSNNPARAQKSGFSFVDKPNEKKIDILYDGKLLTAYCYFDSVMKPVLFPVKTVSGITVTRGYPLEPRPGERVDHPHHIGLWMNYESVNGLDFWNNSTAIPYERRPRYGTIYHDKVVSRKASGRKATLEVEALWRDHYDKLLLIETTTYNFMVDDNDFIIDRTSTLRAAPDMEVTFKDVKDGFLAIRVAREWELPSDETARYVDANGKITEGNLAEFVPATGDYLSSEGIRGNDVWSTRAKWVTLFGRKDGRDVSITIIDHPKNPGYPAYWHARGYGLFAVNPLGQEVFSKGKETLNLKLRSGESVTFRYRIVVHEGQPLTGEQVAAMAKF
jgi:hypothetical protein